MIETVGVGQSETDVADLADTVILAIQPGSGDSLQYMKAGIVEIPDIAVVTKADLGPLAERARRDLELALSVTSQPGGWPPKVLTVAAPSGEGIEELLDGRRSIGAWLAADLAGRREAQGELWLRARGEGGSRRGVPSAPGRCSTELNRSASPFRKLADALRQLAEP